MKLKSFSFLCLAIAVCLPASNLIAQATQTNYFLPTFFPRAPNTSSLEKFGSYDVNLFTGLPGISIPLYTIEAGGIKIPITLSYHASGIKVSDVASWVGLGWSLSAGGTVNRSISGKADDGVGGYLQGYLKSVSSFSGRTNSDIDSLNNYTMGMYDSRPDIFSYDFPGHGGKFFLDGTSNFVPRLIPYAPVKIIYSYSNPNLTKFNLTDEHGDTFLFGDTYLETTYTNTQSTPAVGAISGWPLKSVISQNRRDTVTFTYAQQTVYYPDVKSSTYTVIDSVHVTDGTYNYSQQQGLDNISSSYVNEQLNQQINFKNGKVVFELDPTPRQDLNYSNSTAYRLKDILIYAYNYSTRQMEVQKTVKFYTSNFNPGVSGGMRLKLDSIQILDKAGSVIQHYRFGYNYSITMPYYGSAAKDYWGYYNGQDANTSLIPSMTVQTMTNTGPGQPVYIGGTNSRYSDSTKMQACMLDTIRYPTGGYSVFSYQTNQYMAGGVLQQAGGLRIKSISSYDGLNATPIVKTYQYDLSQARANFLLSNSFFVKTQTQNYWGGVGNGGVGEAGPTNWSRLRTYVSNPSIDVVPWDAATVVYPHVTEYVGTPGANIGKTDYYFRDQTDNYAWPYMYQEQYLTGLRESPIVNSYYYARGQLLTKNEALREADGSYLTVRATTNTYTAYPATTYSAVGLIVVKNIISTPQQFTLLYPDGNSINTIPPPYNGFAPGNYNIVSDDNYLTSTTTSDYDINDPTKYTNSTVNYNYGSQSYQQVASISHADSRGNTRTTNNTYAFNYPAGNAVIDSMVNRHLYSEAVEKTETYTTSAGTATTGAQLNQFQFGRLTNSIVPAKISTLSVIQPLTNFTPSSVASGSLTSDSRYVQMISFDNYDPQNNIIQYTPRNAMPVSVMWDYLYENPVAQVKNALYSTSGVSQNIAYTSFEADGTGGWYVSGTPVFDPAAPTGSKVYPLSSGYISSPSLSTSTGYVLSYWSNNGAATVYAGGYVSGAALRSTNSWTYYEHTIAAGVSSVSISGSTSIDELRLYPTNAQMTTYAYNPSGLTSIADSKGGISYFEYDYFSRLKNVKDWTGNIVKNNGYHTYDQTSGNQVQSASFTRNNCPSGTNPQSLTYTVPANKYYSSSVASANGDAAYDMNLNGQIKANQVCGCPVSQVNFTLSNSTGISTFQVAFSGPYNHTYNFPSSGSTVIQLPAGVYTVQIYPTGTFANHTFNLGTRSAVVAPGFTFTSVSITSSSNESPLSIH